MMNDGRGSSSHDFGCEDNSNVHGERLKVRDSVISLMEGRWRGTHGRTASIFRFIKSRYDVAVNDGSVVNPHAWWQCSIKITVLFVGRCLPGKFHQVDSASAAGSLRWVTFMSCAQNVKIICFSVRTYFRSFNAETCLLEVALNQILYR